MAQRQSKDTKRFKEIVRFLLGEAPLDGHWFGDIPPNPKGRPRPYWWRSHLRGASEKVLYELFFAKERAAPFTGVRPGDFEKPRRRS